MMPSKVSYFLTLTLTLTLPLASPSLGFGYITVCVQTGFYLIFLRTGAYIHLKIGKFKGLIDFLMEAWTRFNKTIWNIRKSTVEYPQWRLFYFQLFSPTTKVLSRVRIVRNMFRVWVYMGLKPELGGSIYFDIDQSMPLHFLPR